MLLLVYHIWVNFLQDEENGQNVAFFYFFGALLWPNGLIFSTFLNCSEKKFTKNVSVLALAHLEPELELFEVWEIMLLQIIITIIANVINFKEL